jgi:hypothetical protein
VHVAVHLGHLQAALLVVQFHIERQQVQRRDRAVGDNDFAAQTTAAVEVSQQARGQGNRHETGIGGRKSELRQLEFPAHQRRFTRQVHAAGARRVDEILLCVTQGIDLEHVARERTAHLQRQRILRQIEQDGA